MTYTAMLYWIVLIACEQIIYDGEDDRPNDDVERHSRVGLQNAIDG